MAMAMSDGLEQGVLDNWVQVAAERGLTLEQVADQVEGESSLLAAALRELGAGRKAEKPEKVERATAKKASTR